MVIKWHALHSIPCKHSHISKISLSLLQEWHPSHLIFWFLRLHLDIALDVSSLLLGFCFHRLVSLKNHLVSSLVPYLLIKPSISILEILGLAHYCKRTFKSPSRYYLLSGSLWTLFYLLQHLHLNKYTHQTISYLFASINSTCVLTSWSSFIKVCFSDSKILSIQSVLYSTHTFLQNYMLHCSTS